MTVNRIIEDKELGPLFVRVNARARRLTFRTKEDGIYVIIAAKNQEEKIEGFLRSIMFKILYGKEEEIKDIIVTDLSSKDKTKEIIEKMAKDYEYLKVSNWKECKDIIDNIDNN